MDLNLFECHRIIRQYCSRMLLQPSEVKYNLDFYLNYWVNQSLDSDETKTPDPFFVLYQCGMKIKEHGWMQGWERFLEPEYFLKDWKFKNLAKAVKYAKLSKVYALDCIKYLESVGSDYVKNFYEIIRTTQYTTLEGFNHSIADFIPFEIKKDFVNSEFPDVAWPFDSDSVALMDFIQQESIDPEDRVLVSLRFLPSWFSHKYYESRNVRKAKGLDTFEEHLAIVKELITPVR